MVDVIWCGGEVEVEAPELSDDESQSARRQGNTTAAPA